MDRGNRARKLFGWWYVSIALGFLLLALHRLMNGGGLRLVALRLVIAAGFGILGVWELLVSRGARRSAAADNREQVASKNRGSAQDSAR